VNIAASTHVYSPTWQITLEPSIMSLEHTRGRRERPLVFEPTYTVDEFCDAERISRSRLYELWQRGEGPEYYLNGISKRITHAARLEWQRQREQAAREGGEAA
jgi:hypothetical protein